MAKIDNIVTQIRPKFVEGRPGHVLEARYFYYETDPQFTDKLAVVCGGYEKCAPDFQLNRSNYPYFVIKYTTKGKGVFQINSRSHQLRQGIISGFSPSIPHKYKADNFDPMEHIFITFLGTEAPALLEKSTLSSEGVVNASNPDRVLLLLQTMLNLGMEKTEYSQELICSYLRILLLEHVPGLSHIEKPCSLSIQTYHRCKKFIDDNFSTLNSTLQVAGNCNINARYMSRLFRRYNYMAPHQYILRLKMNKAVTLLLRSNLSIHQVSMAVGFEDPYHFSRNFKKVHGLSPRNYRLTYG